MESPTFILPDEDVKNTTFYPSFHKRKVILKPNKVPRLEFGNHW
ncbi:hypothetical protein PRBEI_2001091800 [Prionailurus iriomotensis]